jgi:hypothetical protein
MKAYKYSTLAFVAVFVIEFPLSLVRMNKLPVAAKPPSTLCPLLLNKEAQRSSLHRESGKCVKLFDLV